CVLFRDLSRHPLFYGQKGLAIMAISGVDLALWDLRGKRAGQPVARLLNPQVDLAKPIPTYTTVFNDADTQAALAAGHRAIKLHVERFGDQPDPARLAEAVRQVRTAVGPATPLAIDAFGRWDVDTTLRVAEAIAPYDILWLEEPLPPDDLDAY